MKQNIAIMTLFLSGFTEGAQINQASQVHAQNISLAEIASNSNITSDVMEAQEEAKRSLIALEASIQEDPVADEEEADADATDEQNQPAPPEQTEKKPTDAEADKAPAVQPPSTPASLNDEDAKCYSSRYQDIDALLDPKSHFATIGIQQGRLGTCAKKLTDQEVTRYLNHNPDLQRMFGKSGPGPMQQARDHWQNIGYKSSALTATITDKDNLPFKCASGAMESCMCPGTLWFGLATRPDNGAKIETFEDMREWRTLSADSEDWQSCSVIEFGSDPLPGFDKQCFCEVKAPYEASRCADEGDECLCNGHVYFSSRFKADKTTPAEFSDVLGMGFTIVDANNTGTVTCTSDTFDGADPSPDTAKQCFCDDKKQFTSFSEVQSIQEYYRAESMVSTTESEISTVMASQYDAEVAEYEYGEYYSMEDYGYETYGPNGGMDDCHYCEEECGYKSEYQMQQELAKMRNVLRKKYSKMREVNKYRKVTAKNKRIAGDNACTAAQRAKDPAEKKKQRKLCYELRTESSRLTTEAEIEYQNIEDQERIEEKTITEETNKVIKDKTIKNVNNQKTTEINKSKIKEQTSSRITKETDERISLIKKKIETERITEHIITEETTQIEKQITNINKQIEDVENQYTKELKRERDESIDAGEEIDETSISVEKEITKEVTHKKEELTEKKKNITTKIESLTKKTEELETNIQTITKDITTIKQEIENITIITTTYVKRREELHNVLKYVSNTEKTKIQEEIDELTSKITSNKKTLEELSNKREELITEETTSRTDLTYTSQNLKKSENYEQHINEQIVVTDVVISSKEEKIKEETEKKDIISIQHDCFKKRLKITSLKEELKQFKSTLNKRIQRKKMILEVNKMQLKTQMEELYNSNATLITLEDQLKKTTTDGQKAVIKFKIETLKTEIAKFESIVKMYNSTVETLTTEITDLESGKTTIEMTTEITKVELEMQKLMIEASLAMTRLPLFTTELEDSRFGISSSTSASVSHHCGVYSGVTIKGDIGGTSSSTTTSSDINSQIIEKEEYAQKLREEYTKIKEVTIVQKEEIYESITSEKKIIEETEKVISENKSKLTSLRQKEKELNTKITTATESSEIETYKHELTSLISQITTIKNIIKSQTQKKITTTNKITDETNKITEIDSKVESSEYDANNAQNEALTFITEGIEATYVVEKKHIHDKKKSVLKVKETEYKEKKYRYEEEKIKITKTITEKTTKLSSYEQEISDLKDRLKSQEERISSITKEEEKKTLEREITNIKNEIERNKKITEEYKSEINIFKTQMANMMMNWTMYYQNYTTIRAETYNTEEESKEYERITSNRRRHRDHKNTHITKINSHKKKAETHRHACEETKKKVDKQTKHIKKERYDLRCERSRHEHNSKTYTKEITIEEKKIIELRNKLTTIKEESEKIKIQDEITGLEASIETYKQNIKSEISKMHKNEEEETTLSTKITQMQETVKRLEEETIKIENESKIVEKSTTSESAKKVTETIKNIKHIKEDKTKNALKDKISMLMSLLENKQNKIEENTHKIVDQTKLISQSVSNQTRIVRINERQRNVNRYATCQRLLIEEPSYFDVTTICSSMNQGFGGNGMMGGAGQFGMAGGRGLNANSQTCQACYQLNPSCSGTSAGAGVSVVSFSVDTQGEADDLVNALFAENMIADVNFLSAMVNRKFAIYGQVTQDPSQVRVELVTTDTKAQNVVSRITQWRYSQGKSNQGQDNDAVITPLTGGSNEYISFVMRQTSSPAAMPRGGLAGGMQGGMGGGMGGMMGGMGGGMMGGMGGGMMGGMSSGSYSYSYSSNGMMAQQPEEQSVSEQSSEDLGDKPASDSKLETMSDFVSEFY